MVVKPRAPRALRELRIPIVDWDEFHEVLAGRGPANAERIRRRRDAHEQGAWVREAAAEYARKQAERALAASGAVA